MHTHADQTRNSIM